MWGNLARGLRENLDVDALRETISHVADVVAPALSDEEEYETDDEEYEYYDDEEEESSPTETKEESLGAMLKHMLDDEEEQHHRLELKEQEEKYVRPLLPDEEDDDIQEEIISFEQENYTTKEAAAIAIPPPEPSRIASPPLPQTMHFPGVPVPHEHKQSSQKESLSYKKERILSTQPVRREAISVYHQIDTSDVSAVPVPPPAREDKGVDRMSKLPVNEADETPVSGTDTRRVSDSASREPMTNGTSKSVPPPIPKPSVSLPKVVDASVGSGVTDPVINDSKSKESMALPVKSRPSASVTLNKLDTNPRGRSAPPPPSLPPQEQLPPVTRNEPTAKIRTNASPPLPAPKQSLPVPAAAINRNKASEPQKEAIPSTMPPKRPDTQELLQKANQVVKSKKKDFAVDYTEFQKLQCKCQDLQQQLQRAEMHIVELQKDAAQRMDEEEQWRQSHLLQFQEEQARLIEEATEAVAVEHQRELDEMRDLLQQECFHLKQELEQARHESKRQVDKFQQLLKEAEARAETAETEKKRFESKQKSSMSQFLQQQQHAVRMAEDKLAHTLAKLDDREEEIAKLKAAIKELKASTTEHREVAQEAEEEMDELHAENEALQHNLHATEAERDELKKQLKFFESQKEKMSGLQVTESFVLSEEVRSARLWIDLTLTCVPMQMELRMLKEARDRERAHRENAAVDAESNQAELIAERDVALSTARDLERQLTAALADLDIAKADTDRIMMANVNLQSALEAFQNERDAEMNMVQEQQREAETATAAAHAAAIEAMHKANEARMREVQMAADAAVKNVMAEVHELEAKLEVGRMYRW